MLQKTVDQRKRLRRVMGKGIWHPEEASILTDQKPADYWQLKESLQKYSLAEFLGKTQSGSGADYLIPDKLYDTLIFYSKETDKVPAISMAVAERWQGGKLKVAIVNDETYKPHEFGSGGYIASETIETMLPSLDPKGFGIGVYITNDLIEDAQWDMVEFHTRQAAKAMGEYATSLALAVLVASEDGWGSVNTVAGDALETKWSGSAGKDVHAAISENLADGWISNTVVTSGEPWEHSLASTLPTGATWMAVKPGFTHCINNIDVLLHTSATDLTATRLLTVVFDRNNALLSGRKRWMQVENYANPVADLAGAVVTCRQDSVSVYDDAVCKIEEAAE